MARAAHMIGHRTAMGGMLLVGARLITRVIDLATMLVLARLLVPTDFGLVAIAMSAVAIVKSALELPLNQALVRLPLVSRAQYDTAFTLAVLRVLAVDAVILLGAAPFAQFYEDPRLFALVCVLAIGASARGLTSPRMAEYQRDMSFWRDCVLLLGSKCLGFVVGATTAVVTHSYWAIAAGAITWPLTIVTSSYCFAPYRPRFSLAELSSFSGFVGWASAAQVISAVNWQSERLLLGKLQPKASLGLFTTASDISLIPVMAFFGPMIRPLLAAFSLVRNDRARLARSYQHVSAAIMTVGLPILVGECLVAEPVIRLVLGPAWLGAGPLLQWLSLSVIPALFALAAIPLVMSVGETRIFLERNAIEFCVKFPILIVGGIAYGFMGVVAARAVSETVAALFCMRAVRRLVGLSVAAQLLGSWRCFVATMVMVPVVIAALRWPATGQGATLGGLQGALNLAVVAGLGAASYGTALLALWLVSGRPEGVEAMLVNVITGLRARVRRRAKLMPTGADGARRPADTRPHSAR